VDDGLDPEALQLVKDWVFARGGVVANGEPAPPGDFSDTHTVTHQWQESAMLRVGRNKTGIIQWALTQRADAVWFVDADLICDRTTLWSLIHAQRPIACAVYWTHWQRSPTPDLVVHAGPQVWLNHPYDLHGRGMDVAEFRSLLLSKALTQVWGQGACTLIDRKVLEAGINFLPVPGVPTTGLMAGEDRHFCIAAEQRHIPMYADAWPDIYHIYHLPDDLARADAMAQRLGVTHPERARVGDAVSLILEAMEGVPQPSGPPVVVPAQHLRGRLGQLALVPELEEAVQDIPRGESRIVPVHFPAHYPLPQFRGTKRLIRVTVVDVKPWGYPPVVEQELYHTPRTSGHLDATTLTPAQHDSILATAVAL
jgi:hypothetical protein